MKHETVNKYDKRYPVALTSALVLAILIIILWAARIPVPAQIAFVVGCIGTVITVQLDAILRISRGRNEDASSETIAEAMATASAGLYVAIVDATLAAHAASSHPVFTRLVHRKLKECVTHLTNLSDGEATLRYRDDDLITEQVRQSHTSVKAISYLSTDLTWWRSSAGQAFGEENLRAARRGISVFRVFIYDKWTDEIEQIARYQEESGIAVARVSSSAVRPGLRRNLIVLDQSFLVERRANHNGEIVGYRYASDPTRIVDALDAISALSERGERLSSKGTYGGSSDT